MTSPASDVAESHTLPTLRIDDPLLLRLGKLAETRGVQLYAVGGYVRDRLRGAARNDLDCTVVGDALDFAQHVAREFDSKCVVYERFRTALVPVGPWHIEFVGTRKEEYLPHTRNPVVSEGTFEDDLRRRDFTVNAMAVRLHATEQHDAQVIDLFGGMEDFRQKVLRTPLDPVVTFSDDPLRMMRLARFASQLGFAIDPAAAQAVASMADRIKIISQERVTDEFLKTLASPKPSIGLIFLYESGLMKHVFPEVHALGGVDIVEGNERVWAHKDVFYHTMKVVDNLSATSDNVWLRFATLMHDIAKPRTKKFIPGTGWSFHGHEEVGARMQKTIFRRMKLPMENLPYVETLVRLHQRPMVLADSEVTDSAIRRLCVHAGEALDDLFLLCRADITSKNKTLVERYLDNYDRVEAKIREVREKDQLRDFQSPVRGEEIMELCGLTPSKAVGIIKYTIEEAILDGLIPNEYEAAKEYLLHNKEAWLTAIQQGEMDVRRRS